tara:strand:+ start:2752 stop:3078 length:327 start_codon:yes stop_codon:yes gene_type:complete
MGRFITEAGASIVNSVQEVSVSMPKNTTTNSTISAVDLSKTVLVAGSFQNPFSVQMNAGVRERSYGWAYGCDSDLTSTTNVQFVTTDNNDTLEGSSNGIVTLYVLEYV